MASDGSSSNFSFDQSNTPTENKSIDFLKSQGWISADAILVPAHDAAHVHWGGAWRIPTKQELTNLVIKCDWTWTTLNGVQGHVVKGRGTYASASIFLPCAGFGRGTSLDTAGTHGNYWSSNYSSTFLYFYSSHHDTYDSRYRLNGESIRPVKNADQ